MRNLRLTKNHWTPALLSLLLLTAFILIFARRSLPFYQAVREFLAYSPVYRMYLAVSEKSEICPKTEAFEGLREFSQNLRSLDWVSSRCRLVRRDGSGLQLWSTPFGDMWFPGSVEPPGVHFAILQYKNEAYPGLPIRKGDVVLDCGGFVGDWTRFALSAGASRVITVEPSAESLECIRRNLSREIGEGRVIVYTKGLWDGDARLYLQHREGNPAGHSVTGGPSGAGEWIDVTSIDKMVADLAMNRVDVIKMDIEGAETRAIRGARTTLNRFRPRLAVATEHTMDVVQNNRNVIEAVREVAPFYRPRCGYCTITDRGVVPETLYFVQ